MKANSKIRANRTNAQKSTGPRTGAGKLRSSRNVIRHGLASQQESASKEIAAIAEDLCRDDPFPYREHHALAIAEAQVSLERVRKARVATIERLRRFKEPPVGLVNTALSLIAAGDVKAIIALLRRIKAVNKELLKRMKAGERTLPKHGIVAEYFLEFCNLKVDRPPNSLPTRSEIECVLRTLPELIRLERYERRALGRKRRAIRAFAARLDR